MLAGLSVVASFFLYLARHAPGRTSAPIYQSFTKKKKKRQKNIPASKAGVICEPLSFFFLLNFICDLNVRSAKSGGLLNQSSVPPRGDLQHIKSSSDITTVTPPPPPPTTVLHAFFIYI